MLFGFFPSPIPPPTVGVGGMKAYGIENAGSVVAGPSWSYGTQSHSKNNQITQQFGDLATSPVFWATVYDPDWIDHPIHDVGV